MEEKYIEQKFKKYIDYVQGRYPYFIFYEIDLYPIDFWNFKMKKKMYMIKVNEFVNHGKWEYYHEKMITEYCESKIEIPGQSYFPSYILRNHIKFDLVFEQPILNSDKNYLCVFLIRKNGIFIKLRVWNNFFRSFKEAIKKNS